MATKQHGGDWLDKIQAHNRNVYLEAQAKHSAERAKYERERARQAQLEREEKEAHNAAMRKIAQQKADAEEARLQIAREERARKEREKQEIGKIHALSRRVKEIDGASDVIKKFMLVIELQTEAGWIDLDSVLDLAYKDRFCETMDIIETALSSLYEEAGKDAVYLKAYATAIKKAADTEIHSLADTHKFKRAMEAEKRFPELASPELKKYQHEVEKFLKRATAAKSDFAFFQDKMPPEHHDLLKKFIAQKNDLSIDIFSDPEYESLNIGPLTDEDFSAMSNMLKQYLDQQFLDDAIPTEALQPLCDFFAENGLLDKINLEEYRERREKYRAVGDIIIMALDIFKSEFGYKSFKIINYRQDISKADDLIAETNKKDPVCERMRFYVDHVCWTYNYNPKYSFSISWDELAESWERDYKKDRLSPHGIFRGHRICFDHIIIFESIIEYKKRKNFDKDEFKNMIIEKAKATKKEIENKKFYCRCGCFVIILILIAVLGAIAD